MNDRKNGMPLDEEELGKVVGGVTTVEDYGSTVISNSVRVSTARLPLDMDSTEIQMIEPYSLCPHCGKKGVIDRTDGRKVCLLCGKTVTA